MKSPSLPAWGHRCVCLFVLCSPIVAMAATLDIPGIANLQKVNDEVYRGAQPTDLGFAGLAKLGVKTVVDLRQLGEHSQADEQRLVEQAGMHYVSVPMKGMTTPTADEVSKVLGLLYDKTAGPVFVHCKRGADRTGAVIACYRIGHDHWENQKALSEARSLGMSWYQHALQKYVLKFQQSSMPDLAKLVPAVALP